MQALNLFHQNFAVAESLLQIHQLFHGLEKIKLENDVRLALCSLCGAPENEALKPAQNDRVLVLARAAAPVPESLTLQGGLDFLLREAIVVACTSLEAFFWDTLRENILTVVKARRTGADESIRKLTFTLGDYISIQQYEDPDLRLKQIILKNFERGTLHDVESISKIAGILTVREYWERIEEVTGEPAKNPKRHIGELITRRNQIAHRADRPDEGEESDSLGMRPIKRAWANLRIQAAKTLVTASADLFQESVQRLESEIQRAQEQEEARKVLKQISNTIEDP